MSTYLHYQLMETIENTIIQNLVTNEEYMKGSYLF